MREKKEEPASPHTEAEGRERDLGERVRVETHTAGGGRKGTREETRGNSRETLRHTHTHTHTERERERRHRKAVVWLGRVYS